MCGNIQRLRKIFFNRKRLKGAVKSVHQKLESGPMPTVMAAQPNIGGALCESSAFHSLYHAVKLVYQPRRRPNTVQNLVAWPPVSDVRAVMTPRRETC